MTFAPVAISAYTATTALGPGREALFEALRTRRSGLQQYESRCDFALDGHSPSLKTWIGEVPQLRSVTLPEQWARYDCRNNRLAWLGLRQDQFIAKARAAVERYGADRVAVIVGTSTSGIGQAEQAYGARDACGRLPASFDYAATLNNFSAPSLVAQAVGATGPTFAISTACSSSAKVFAAAARLMRAGWIDAAVVGGVDSLCLTTLCGFASLELLSNAPCRPFDRARSGISIGEGAGFALLEASADAPLYLLGAGESSDAHHMSTPHPAGLGARLAMRGALDAAGLAPPAVDYINLHGTATRSNDPAEGRAVTEVFGATATSSTKGWFGHLLGAAGIVESIVALLALERGLLPGTLNTADVDPECPNTVLLANETRAIDVALSNSFGFGGSNCSVIFGREPVNPRRLNRTLS
ncbi:MAG: beta-ketoacyl-[acyl-carrier-protein] synthase family protein [Pseudomonadota bacterium]|nr:beta-ketoacyl-[acyl-carrier-protein] synthase family protein [Pseudomonadota bacterium]